MTQLTEERKQEIIAEVLAARANREQFLLEMKQRQQAGLKIAGSSGFCVETKPILIVSSAK